MNLAAKTAKRAEPNVLPEPAVQVRLPPQVHLCTNPSWYPMTLHHLSPP
jgi:hypothetical protein